MEKRKKSLQKKIPLTLALFFSVSMSLEIIALVFILDTAYERLLQRDLYGKTSQFAALMEREIENLSSITESYALWNSSLDFVRGLNATYPEDNYGSDWRRSQSVDLVLVLDSSGRRLFSNAASQGIENPDSGIFGKVTFDRKDVKIFPADYDSKNFKPVKGFAVLDGIPCIYVAWPITDDLRTIRPEGLLIFARRLSKEMVSIFLASPYTTVKFIALSSADLSQLPLHADVQDGYLVFYSVVTDVAGNSIGAWKLSLRKDLPPDLAAIMASIVGVILALMAFKLGATVFLIKRKLIDPLVSINSHLDSFSLTGERVQALRLGNGDELQKVASHVNQLVKRVGIQAEELDRIAGTDGLTGLCNRKKMECFMDLETRRMRRRRYESFTNEQEVKHGKLGFILVDIDAFRRYNEIYGHGQGDECLRKVAAAIRGVVCRPSDLVCRFEGACFAIVLPDTDEDGAMGLAERAFDSIVGLRIPHAGSSVSVVLTASFGLAAAPVDDSFEPKRLIDLSGRALSAAKDNGRNRIVRASLMGKINGFARDSDL